MRHGLLRLLCFSTGPSALQPHTVTANFLKDHRIFLELYRLATIAVCPEGSGVPGLHKCARCCSSTMFGMSGRGGVLQKLLHARKPRILLSYLKTSTLNGPSNCLTHTFRRPACQVLRANPAVLPRPARCRQAWGFGLGPLVRN